jgi:hypothetical protein
MGPERLSQIWASRVADKRVKESMRAILLVMEDSLAGETKAVRLYAPRVDVSPIRECEERAG